MNLIESIVAPSVCNNFTRIDLKSTNLKSNLLIQFRNCRLVRDGRLVVDDLWVRDGKIMSPEKIFFEEKSIADLQLDCNNLIVAPGFIDAQLNGGFGKDFTYDTENIEDNLDFVSSRLLPYGVTAYCPTIVSSPPDTYAKLLAKIASTLDTNKLVKPQPKRAYIIGAHLEGPFISKEKQGAHETQYLREIDNGVASIEAVYGGSVSVLGRNVSIVTLAPELDKTNEVVRQLTRAGIVVSLGHSSADLATGERAFESGARFITHLFNAMAPFHHRDPHLIGLLSNRNLVKQENIYYGIISDGIHTHPSALNVAYKAHPNGLVLVTDSMSAMGLDEGIVHQLGSKRVQIVKDEATRTRSAYVEGTNTLCGAVATMDDCIRNLMRATGCSLVEALECASAHPAKMLRIYPQKGSLDFGADADFVLLDDEVNIHATFINGDFVWSRVDWCPKYTFTK